MPNDRRNKQILPGASIYILATVASVTPNRVLAIPQAPGQPPQDAVSVHPAAVLIAGDGVELVLPEKDTTFQDRVIAEKAELDERLGKLQDFLLVNPAFSKLPESEQDRLKSQLDIMRLYSDILGDRISNFATLPTTTTLPPVLGTPTSTTEAPKTGTQASEDFLLGRNDGLKGNHDSGPASDDYQRGFAEGVELREQEGRAETVTSTTEPPAEDTSAA